MTDWKERLAELEAEGKYNEAFGLYATKTWVPRKRKRQPEQRVYFIGGRGIVKIGIAEYPRQRLQTLQTSSPFPLQLLAICEGGRKKEKQLHAQFADARQAGEWFVLTPELQDYIDRLDTVQ